VADAARDAVLEAVTPGLFGRDPCRRLHAREVDADPEHDRDAEDDRPGAPQEGARAAPNLRQPEPERRNAVRRQLHEEREAFPGEDRLLEDRRDGERGERAEQVEAEERETLQSDRAEDAAVGDERADQQRVDGKPRRARHQRRDEDRRDPVARRRDRSRRHDSGDGAGVRREQRHEAASLEADASHQAVDHERGARHVADVVEQIEQREQDHDLRDEDDDGADAADHALGEKVRRPARGQRPREPPRRTRDRGVEQIHRGLRPGEDELKEEHHHHREEERARDRVEHDAVDRVRHPAAARALVQHAAQHRRRPRRALGGRCGRREDRPAPRLGAAEQPPQHVDADAAVTDHADDRNADAALEPLEVEASAARDELVDHREDEAGRKAEAQDLRHEQERAVERAGVGDDDERIGRGDAFDLAPQHAHHDRLVGADRIEAVRPREVDHDRAPPVEGGLPLATLDRHAGVVADLRAQAGERVEDRRLAAVGTPDEPEAERGGRGGGRRGHAIRRTRIRSASLRRRQSW